MPAPIRFPSSPPKHPLRLLSALLLFLLLAGPGFPQVSPLFRNPVRETTLSDILFEGNRTVDKSLLTSTLHVKKGESYLPGVLREKVRESVLALYKLGLFSDIQVETQEADSADGTRLVFRFQELPTLAKVDFEGEKKLKKDDIKEAMDLLDGQVYSKSAVERNRQKILNLYRDKGYLLAEVDVVEKDEKETGKKIITFKIREGRKVAVRYITFTGNRAFRDKELRQKLPTKEDRWWRTGEYKEDEFLGGLDSLVDFYRTQGYLDARIPAHKVLYTPDRKHLDISIRVSEGRRYRFGKAMFAHNGIVEDKALHAQVQLDSGEIFDIRKYELTKYNVTSLYREEGYLFVEVQDQKTYRDSLVDVTFNIHERSIAHIRKVQVRGNTKTRDKVIRREVKLFPGDIFRQSLVLRSARDIMQLNYFDNVNPNFEPVKDAETGEVDLVFEVTEKASGTGTFSAGAAYSQRDQFVGTLGLQIPNLFGNGQRADMNVEYGANKQLYSLGFTEPWFLDTPTLLGGSVFYNYQRGLRGDNDFERKGLRLNLGRRLTWPDDYFFVRSSYNLTVNDNGEVRDRRFLVVNSGLESSVNLTVVRDDKDLPVFPTEGSRYSFDYSRVGGPFGGSFDYSEYVTGIRWWFPTFHKFVLGLQTEFGLLYGTNLQSYDLYQMGGLLGYQGRMRGYGPGSIGAARIGRSYFSFVTELTYPVAENTFYLLSFFDAGNVYGQQLRDNNPLKRDAGKPWDEIDLSDLRRDYGFGFRLVVPLVGIMGFDFGWALDEGEDYDTGARRPEDGMQVNFTVEQGF